MKRALAVPAVAALALAGCSSCPAPSTTGSLSRTATLDGATPTTFAVDLVVPPQDCGCTWCGDPVATVAFSFDATWSHPAAPSPPDAPVVRFTLAQAAPDPTSDAVTPALPVDVLLDGAGTATASIQATTTCSDSPPCVVAYALTLARVEHVPAGEVSVAWTATATYVSRNPPGLAATP